VTGIVLDSDSNALRSRFLAGELDLYIGNSREVDELQAALATNGQPELEIGVTELPSGPNRPAGPLLIGDAFAFSQASSRQETVASMVLVNFMTNPQTQAELATTPIGRFPAREGVSLGANLPASTQALAGQVYTGVPIFFAQRQVWQMLADPKGPASDFYSQALSGILPSGQAVDQITRQITERFDLAASTHQVAAICPQRRAGESVHLSLWHALAGQEADALARVVEKFEATCRGVTIELSAYTYTTIDAAFRAAYAEGNGPTMLLESTRLTPQLVADELIIDVGDLVPSNELQLFIPSAEEAMRVDGRLYGIPESITVLALFINTTLAPEPLVNLDEVAFTVDAQRRFALPANFFFGYWGMAPFGGFAFDPATGEILNSSGLTGWLEWLRRMQGQPGMDIVTDFAVSETQFAHGEAAYFVSGPWSLPTVTAGLGRENFQIAALPYGPQGPGQAILQVQGIMISAAAREAEVELAAAFGRFLANSTGQTEFAATGSHIPALVGVDLSADPHLQEFREQAKTAVVVNENLKFAAIELLGNALYQTVLEGGRDPATAVAEFEAAAGNISQPDPLPR
jgi:ABC-type glycerol-3-phosphate transport system substrate-binding protein